MMELDQFVLTKIAEKQNWSKNSSRIRASNASLFLLLMSQGFALNVLIEETEILHELAKQKSK